MLPKKYKLKRKKDFQRVFDKGRYYQKDFISIKLFKNELEYNRFGIIVGSKISKKAVIRNQIKRRIEENIRYYLPELKTGFDLVIITKSQISQVNYQEIKKRLIFLFKEANLIKSEKD